MRAKVDASKQELIDAEALKISNARERQDELNEEYLKLNETMQKFQNARKIESDWSELFRSIDSSLPASVLDPEELKVGLLASRKNTEC